MIRLIDIMAVSPVSIQVARPRDRAEHGFRLGTMMDKVNRRSSDTVLVTTFDASHSGTIVNNRCYPGVHMRDSMQYWTTPYAKPVLSRHPHIGSKQGEPEPEVFGRARLATYIPFMDDERLKNDWRTPSFRGRGSGYAEVKATMTHAGAIEELLDGRFLTVSSGMDSDRLMCSHCGRNWAAKGRCDHTPGRVYTMQDSKQSARMYLVTGHLFYDHLARVNTPAQPYSTALSNEFVDKKTISELFSDGQVLEAPILGLTLIDSRDGLIELGFDAEASHADPTSAWTAEDWARGQVLTALADAGRLDESYLKQALPAVEAFRTSERKPSFGQPRFRIGPGGSIPIMDALTADVAASIVKDGGVAGADPASLGSRISECMSSFVPVSVSFGDSTMLTPEQLKAAWDEIVKASEGLTDEECSKWDDWDGDFYDLAAQDAEAELLGVQAQIIDARLTTESRKQLPDSAFCGPNRSFPVHDAAHVRNALARLPQAKNFTDAQKSRILACVRSRAKRFGVEVSGDALSFDKVNALWDRVNNPASLQDLDTTPPPDGETPDQKIARLESQLNASKARIQDLDGQVHRLLDEKRDLEAEVKRTLANRLFDARVQLKKPDVAALTDNAKRQEYLTRLEQRSTASLRDSLADLEVELTPAGKPSVGKSVDDPTKNLVDNSGNSDDAGDGKGGKTGGKGQESENKSQMDLLKDSLNLAPQGSGGK